MKSPRPKPKKAEPKPSADLTRIEEANVARLGLISIQERIPSDFTSWVVDFQVDGRPARLSCVSPGEYGGVPHGLDGDITTAINDLYVEAGSSADGLLQTTAYQILQRAGLDQSGRYHQALKQSLMRLRTTTYIASEAWRDHRKGNWTTVTFNYLAGLEFTSDSDQAELSRASTLKLRLAEPIVKSIAAKYTKPSDLDFIRSLDRPITRAVYRLLDARRYSAVDPTSALPQYSVNLIEWAEACKILDRRSNKIRSTLQGAHDELIARQYLTSVEYDGRGQKQQVTYTFNELDVAQTPAPSALLQALLGYGVSAPIATRLVTDFGEEFVQRRLAKYQQLIAGGYRARNRSALLVDVIRDHEGKYPELDVATATLRVVDKALPTYMPTLEEASSDTLPLEAQVESTLKTLQFLLRERLSVSEYALLRMGLIMGQPDSREAMRAATIAKRDGTLDTYTAELVTVIHSL